MFFYVLSVTVRFRSRLKRAFSKARSSVDAKDARKPFTSRGYPVDDAELKGENSHRTHDAGFRGGKRHGKKKQGEG